MARKNAINHQVTDTQTQSAVATVGVAPSVAMGEVYQASSQALAQAAHNAALAQQQTNLVAQAATEQGVALLYALDVGAAKQSLLAMINHKK